MFQIRTAERRKAKLRLALLGISGSGKTFSALTMAKGMGGKICVIDTENRSADLYANEFDYDVCELSSPFTPERYVTAIKQIEKAGYDIIIIDSLSHAWSGEGGALDMLENAKRAQRGAQNSFTAWRDVTPEHNKLVNAILQSECHVIITMRCKSHYDMQENDNGKKVPVKIGLAPIQREGMDFEFTVVLDLNQEHYASPSKDRTQLFDKKNFIITENTGIELISWLNSGKDEDLEKDLEIITLCEHYVDRVSLCESIEEAKEIATEGWNELKKFKSYKGYDLATHNLKKSFDEKKKSLIQQDKSNNETNNDN